MQKSLNPDATGVERALRLYQKLLLDGRRHFQGDLAEYLACSPQTVIRLIAEIEAVVGACLVTGYEGRRRWYQIRSVSRNMLGLDFEELRYLSICRDLAAPYLPAEVKERVDASIFNFSVLMADREYAIREKAQKEQVGYCAKGRIDYTPFFGFLEKLAQAIEEKRICVVRYRATGRSEAKEFRFAPNKIIGMNNALYALGALVVENMRESQKPVNFAVHRFKDVILTDKTRDFEIPTENLELFGLTWHEPKIFRIRFRNKKAADYVRERVWSEKQRFLEEPDGSLILEIRSRSEPELRAWARSFGDAAELVEDEDLRK